MNLVLFYKSTFFKIYDLRYLYIFETYFITINNNVIIDATLKKNSG